MEDNNKSIDEFRKELTRTKTDSDVGLGRKMEALEAQIKVLDSDLSKCTFDWRERCDTIAADVKSLEVHFNSQFANFKDMFQDGDSNLDARIQVALSKLQEKIKLQTEEGLLEIKDRFNENLDLIETKFKQNNTQIKAFVE